MNFQDAGFIPGGETLLALRKRALMAILAREEMPRLGLAVDEEALAAMARWFRCRFELTTQAELERFLAFAGLDRAGFSMGLRDFVCVAEVEASRSKQIDDELARYRAMLSVRDYLMQKEPR
jgi:hypothetical protein